MAKKKKKRIEPKVAKRSQVDIESLEAINELKATLSVLNMKLDEAIECLKHYTKKDQIGELANQAIELLTKFGVQICA